MSYVLVGMPGVGLTLGLTVLTPIVAVNPSLVANAMGMETPPLPDDLLDPAWTRRVIKMWIMTMVLGAALLLRVALRSA